MRAIGIKQKYENATFDVWFGYQLGRVGFCLVNTRFFPDKREKLVNT
jgi:hypothetical protein